MKSAMFATFLVSVVMMSAAAPKSEITVCVEWTNFDELRCEGCRTQTVTMKAGSYYITAHKRGDKMIYTKIAGERKGKTIKVTLTNVDRMEKETFVDRDGTSAIVAKGESRELRLGDIKFLVSAFEVNEREPNH
jgi:hypothetical protein